SKTEYAGVDIERIHPRIKKIAPKFLSEREKNDLQRETQKAELPRLYIIWGAKEVLFKIYGRGGILFKEHLLTGSFAVTGKGTLTAQIVKGAYNNGFLINYEFINGLLLAYSFG